MIPRIQAYFSMSSTTAITYPDKIKRPYWSIIKHLIKDQYNIFSSEYTMNVGALNVYTPAVSRYQYVNWNQKNKSEEEETKEEEYKRDER